jgi:hypothetical protein
MVALSLSTISSSTRFIWLMGMSVGADCRRKNKQHLIGNRFMVCSTITINIITMFQCNSMFGSYSMECNVIMVIMFSYLYGAHLTPVVFSFPLTIPSHRYFLSFFAITNRFGYKYTKRGMYRYIISRCDMA